MLQHRVRIGFGKSACHMFIFSNTLPLQPRVLASSPGDWRSTLDHIPQAAFCLSTFPPIIFFQLLLVSLKPSCLSASFYSSAFCREQFQEALSRSSDPDRGRPNRNSCLSGRQFWFCLRWTVDRFQGF